MFANNNLALKLPTDIEGFSVGEDGKPYITYKVGADSVTKKLGSVELTNLLPLWNNAYCVYSKDIGDWGSVGERKSTRLSDEEGLFVCANSSSSTSYTGQGFISASPNCTFDGWSMARTQFTYNGHIYYVYWIESMRSGYMIYAHSNSTGERSGMNAVINSNGVITDTAFDFFMKIFDYYLYET